MLVDTYRILIFQCVDSGLSISTDCVVYKIKYNKSELRCFLRQ